MRTRLLGSLTFCCRFAVPTNHHRPRHPSAYILVPHQHHPSSHLPQIIEPADGFPNSFLADNPILGDLAFKPKRGSTSDNAPFSVDQSAYLDAHESALVLGLKGVEPVTSEEQ